MTLGNLFGSGVQEGLNSDAGLTLVLLEIWESR